MTCETTELLNAPTSIACVLKRSWPATPNNVTRSRSLLLERLRAEGVGDATLDAIGTAFTEAATNAVYHAYVGRRVGEFQITAAIAADEIAVTVDDDGCGFDPHGAAGRGLPLIAALADRAETSSRPGGGTITAMGFRREPMAAEG